MKQTISETVGRWVEEENHPKMVTVIRKNSPWYDMGEEEIEDRKEFIRCYLLKDFEPILMIPARPKESDFWFASHQEFIESPFNTWDFQKMRRPFDKYGYRVKKVLEQVKDLALLHSCISQPEGRKNFQARFETLVNNEFRHLLLTLVDRHKRTLEEEGRLELKRKIARLSGHILACKRVWEKYSPWEDTTSQHVQIDSINDSQTSSLEQEEVFQRIDNEVVRMENQRKGTPRRRLAYIEQLRRKQGREGIEIHEDLSFQEVSKMIEGLMETFSKNGQGQPSKLNDARLGMVLKECYRDLKG